MIASETTTKQRPNGIFFSKNSFWSYSDKIFDNLVQNFAIYKSLNLVWEYE